MVSLFIRLIRLMITSIICSLPIYFGYVVTISDNNILLLSFVFFIVLTGIDAYRFSFNFWKIRDCFSGIILPVVVYDFLGFITVLSFKPVIFNRIFLPLRFADCFGMKTGESVLIISICVIVMVTVLSFIGSRMGSRIYNMYLAEDEEQ